MGIAATIKEVHWLVKEIPRVSLQRNALHTWNLTDRTQATYSSMGTAFEIMPAKPMPPSSYISNSNDAYLQQNQD